MEITAEAFISTIAVLIAVASWIEARRSRRVAEKARKLTFRPELQKIRTRWRDEVAPSLGAHGGVLTQEQDLRFTQLVNDTKVVSADIHGAMRRAYILSGDITAIHATIPGSRQAGREAAKVKSGKFRELRGVMEEVFDAIEEELRAQL
jgi:hypothetical protein